MGPPYETSVKSGGLGLESLWSLNPLNETVGRSPTTIALPLATTYADSAPARTLGWVGGSLISLLLSRACASLLPLLSELLKLGARFMTVWGDPLSSCPGM